MNFQQMILRLEQYWSDYGCLIWQPYDEQKGAGTFNPATFLRSLGPEPWKAAYVEPSRPLRSRALLIGLTTRRSPARSSLRLTVAIRSL